MEDIRSASLHLHGALKRDVIGVVGHSKGGNDVLLYAAKVGCQRTVPVQGNRPRSASFARNDPLNAPLDFGRPPRSQYDGDIPLIVNLAGRFHMKDGITDRFGQGEHRGPLLLGWGRGGAGHRCVPWFGAAVPRVCGHASHAGSRCHSAFLGASGSRAGRLRPWVRCTALVSNPGPLPFPAADIFNRLELERQVLMMSKYTLTYDQVRSDLGLDPRWRVQGTFPVA